MITLASGEKTPKEIAITSGYHLSHVSSTLSALRLKRLVLCLTPNLKRGKIYGLSDIGKEIANEIINRKT